jgi:hypothetical protein
VCVPGPRGLQVRPVWGRQIASSLVRRWSVLVTGRFEIFWRSTCIWDGAEVWFWSVRWKWNIGFRQELFSKVVVCAVDGYSWPEDNYMYVWVIVACMCHP